MRRLALFLARFGCVPAALAPAKPRVRINQYGWIRHDGGPFPFHPDVFAEVLFEGGDASAIGNERKQACHWPHAWWRWAGDPRWNIRFYRLAPAARENVAERVMFALCERRAAA